VLEALTSLFSDDLLVCVVPIFLLALVVEAVPAFRNRTGLYDIQDTVSSIAMGALALVVEAGPKVVAFVLFDVLHELSPLRGSVGRSLVGWVSLFLLDDLTYYAFHRSNHAVRLLWAGHVPHHSSRRLNLATALRQGVGERLHKFFFWLPLPLLGFDPVMVFTVMSFSLVYQFFIHTQMVGRLPAVIEYVFNTPSHHRVHHASNAVYLDKNHGGVLIVWDRLFGTFCQELPWEPPRFGLTSNVHSYRPLTVATHEYQAIYRDLKACSSLSEMLYCVFGPPDQRRRRRAWSQAVPHLRGILDR